MPTWIFRRAWFNLITIYYSRLIRFLNFAQTCVPNAIKLLPVNGSNKPKTSVANYVNYDWEILFGNRTEIKGQNWMFRIVHSEYQSNYQIKSLNHYYETICTFKTSINQLMICKALFSPSLVEHYNMLKNHANHPHKLFDQFQASGILKLRAKP